MLITDVVDCNCAFGQRDKITLDCNLSPHAVFNSSSRMNDGDNEFIGDLRDIEFHNVVIDRAVLIGHIGSRIIFAVDRNGHGFGQTDISCRIIQQRHCDLGNRGVFGKPTGQRIGHRTLGRFAIVPTQIGLILKSENLALISFIACDFRLITVKQNINRAVARRHLDGAALGCGIFQLHDRRIMKNLDFVDKCEHATALFEIKPHNIIMK